MDDLGVESEERNSTFALWTKETRIPGIQIRLYNFYILLAESRELKFNLWEALEIKQFKNYNLLNHFRVLSLTEESRNK